MWKEIEYISPYQVDLDNEELTVAKLAIEYYILFIFYKSLYG